MIHVDRVDLGPLGVILPSDQVGMIIAQPFLELSATEPFRCTEESKPRQLRVISEVMDLARARPHGAAKTHFTVFPEYSIPGLEGVEAVEEKMANEGWPVGTIVLGGTDGLSKADYASLLQSQRSHVNQSGNCVEHLSNSEWVNCAIIWVKTAAGSVERWLQPKLYPAWTEQDIDYQAMFRGTSVFSFRGPFEDGTFYRFSSLICFDWIAMVSGKRAWQWPLEDLFEQAAEAGAEIPLSWFFVLEHNPRPSHHAFLTQIDRFFDQVYLPNVRRERSCLVFANTAGKPRPGRVADHGGTSLIFTRQTLFSDPASYPTFSNGGFRFRSSNMLQAYRDIFFREGGACIHSFVQVNPNSLIAGAAGRAFALKRAFVFPLYDVNDPRVPSDAVPSSIKWLNDELDEIESLAAAYHAAPLSNEARATHLSSTVIRPAILTP